MKNIIKALSLLSIFAVIPEAMAATSRVSMISRASPRLPSIAGYITAVTKGTTTTTTPSTSLWGDVDCINNYTDCITADDVCGADFEECTTNVLFHAQMPKCLNVLYQCKPEGINSLFGTSAVTALSEIYSWKDDAHTEVDRYKYPLDGSILGQRIIGGAISNQLTTDQCVRRYTSCLQRDDICGSDFELCTSQPEFKKQAVLCASTLARCQNEAKKELFGSVENATALRPSGEDVRLKVMIEQGAQLAAMNAVKTCQRVTDNCLVSACLNNPWRCVEGTSMKKISAADFIGANTNTDTAKTATIGYVPKKDKDGNIITDTPVEGTLLSDFDLYALTGSDVRKLLKAQCLETIGANKYCHMTYREKSPNNKDLMDIDLQEDVFSLAYATRKEMVNTKIQEELKKFDTKAKEACVETIASCAMRSCGGGIGSVCYTDSKDDKGNVNINEGPYNEIKAGCAAIVNTDPNCIYAATASDNNGYEYAYINNTTFDTLFPELSNTGTTADPIGAVAYLNSLLATSYNAAAIEALEKQCRNTALSCVRSMCGKDYENCYRNRTDIISGTYETNTTLDKSMNKMGGVLDYNIVIGLCMNTITEASSCNEHLKIIAKGVSEDLNSVWTGSQVGATVSFGGRTFKFADSKKEYSSVGEAWGAANATRAKKSDIEIVTDCKSNTNLPNASPACSERAADACGTIDEDGCIYEAQQTETFSEFALSEASKSLFQKVLANVEKEVQAKYNAKLTKEQNVCLANNNGGIMGASDNGSTFMWVKLRSNKLPKSYAVKGLTAKQFQASNDLYGSFCRARITVTSDDKDIQDMLGDKATAYFAVGDTFTCGSWIDNSTLMKISDGVGQRELCKQGYGKWDSDKRTCSGMSTKEKVAYAWSTVAPALAGGAITTGLSESGLLGGWINKANGKSSQKQDKKLCISYADSAISNATGNTLNATAVSYLKSASSICSDVVASNRSDGCNSDKEQTSNQTVADAARRIKDLCENASDIHRNTEDDKASRIAIPIVSTIASGALGVGITASVIESKKESIRNEAAQKWMEEIGEHIRCFVGTDELGSYGDTIAIEID